MNLTQRIHSVKTNIPWRYMQIYIRVTRKNIKHGAQAVRIHFVLEKRSLRC